MQQKNMEPVYWSNFLKKLRRSDDVNDVVLMSLLLTLLLTITLVDVEQVNTGLSCENAGPK